MATPEPIQLHPSPTARANARWSVPARKPTPGRDFDLWLVGLICERSTTAFELLYDEHSAAALGLARRMVGDNALAEDVTQEAFVSIWRGSHLYRAHRGSVRTWVLGVTRHRAIDALRRTAARPALDRNDDAALEQELAESTTESEVLLRDEASMVGRAIAALPEDQRQALKLAFFGGLTHTEIATELGLPLGTVKGRLRLALEKLRRSLGPVG